MGVFTAIALLLLTMTAGFFLLAQVQKDNLGRIYRYAAYFVIGFSFVAMIVAVCCGLCRMMCKRGGCGKDKCHKEMMYMHGGMHGGMMECGPGKKKIMIQKGMGGMNCESRPGCGPKDGCQGMGDACCEGHSGKKEEVVKDTLIKKE
ncbi:MAG: hypothetical protein AB1458_13010 [Bacteroidota bacterium]